MDRVERYSNILKEVIGEYYNLYRQMPDAQTVQIIDPLVHHYQIIQTGWDLRHRRIYTSLHFSLQDNKVYVHSDPTEEGIARVLMEKGIPQADIVLEYQPPSLREYTSFAKA
jgi:hypothetical protein